MAVAAAAVASSSSSTPSWAIRRFGGGVSSTSTFGYYLLCCFRTRRPSRPGRPGARRTGSTADDNEDDEDAASLSGEMDRLQRPRRRASVGDLHAEADIASPCGQTAPAAAAAAEETTSRSETVLVHGDRVRTITPTADGDYVELDDSGTSVRPTTVDDSNTSCRWHFRIYSSCVILAMTAARAIVGFKHKYYHRLGVV